jgi:hypothetical protein
MATPRRTATGPTCVSNAENSTTQRLAKRVKIPLQNVVSVEEHIPQITKAVNIIITRNRKATQKP